MDTWIIDGGERPYKPRRCCECGDRPDFCQTEDGPAWICKCGAYAVATPSRETCGRTACKETHDLRLRVMELFGALCDDIQQHAGCSKSKARQKAYAMGSAILRKPMAFRLLSADQARKLIGAWSVE